MIDPKQVWNEAESDHGEEDSVEAVLSSPSASRYILIPDSRESMGNIRHPNASDMEFFDRHDRGSNPATPSVRGVFHTTPHSTEYGIE